MAGGDVDGGGDLRRRHAAGGDGAGGHFRHLARSGRKTAYFYHRTRPAAWGWKRIARLAPEIPADREGWYNLADWLLGSVMVYLFMFGIGKIIIGPAWLGYVYIAVGVVCGAIIYYDFSKRGLETFAGKQAAEAEETR